ncbi:MAG: tyrosine-type recombinase/integrase [Prevotella sp.]|nr:tyrosine-type recombinase/integrase [Prevotella sp.]
MKQPVMKFVYDRRKVGSSKHEAAVELRVTYGRSAKYLSTGVRLLPKQWKDGVVRNRADSVELNEALDAILIKARKAVNAMMERGNFSLSELPTYLKRSDSVQKTFLQFCEERTRVRVYGKKGDTCARYERWLRWMAEWGKIVFFADVTDVNIIEMDKALAATGMKNYSKWNNYHRFMNSFILDAIDEGLLRRNPYKWVHIEKDKTHGLHKYLTLDEFRRIERTIMPTESLERVRDLFVFQTYTCLSYSDMQKFDAGEIKGGVYTSQRQKTGQEFTFLLMDSAQRILDKYGGRLPLISNVKYNFYLKAVAQNAKIDKPITSHWARHTGATILLNEGVDMEVVAKILGHSSIRETRDTYAKLLDTTVAKEMAKVEKKIAGA